MAIISFDRSAVIDYVPEYNGNRESAEPCVVRLRFVPYEKVQSYARLIAARMKGSADPVKAAESGHLVQKKQFTDNVDSVVGYYVEGREVADAEEFYETADAELVMEVVRAMESISRLNDGQRKN